MKLNIDAISNKTTYEISPIVDGDVTWTTERMGTPSKLEFSLIKNGDISYHEGDRVTFIAPQMNIEGFEKKQDTNMFVGYVFKKSKNQLEIKTTCYDQLRYLKAKQSYNIMNMTVDDVIKMIAGEFGLTVSKKLVDTGYIMPTRLYEDMTLIDIITDCVSQTIVATGKIYTFFDDFGELNLQKAEDMQSEYIIGVKSFVDDYTYNTSIEEAYNYIKLVRPNKNSNGGDTYEVRDNSAMKRWGMLQYYEKVDENMNPAQIKERVEMFLKYYCQPQRSLKLSCQGIPGVRAGSMIIVDIPELGDINLSKMLLVDKCTHRISASSHTMDLEMRVHNG